MSDDTTQAFLAGGRGDDELAEDNRRFAAAMAEDKASSFTEKAKQIGADLSAGANRTMEFLLNVPRDIGAGAYKALLNTVDTASDFAGEAVEGIVNQPADTAQRAAKTVGNKEGESKAKSEKIDIPSLSEAFPEFWKSAHEIADTAAVVRITPKGVTLSAPDRPEDAMLEGVSQFALPFAGYLKAAGGLDKLSKVKTVARAAGAEAATAGSAFDPHEGRFADLVQMGREMENRFGEVMRNLSPDGSMVNRYIDWMTAREGEGKWEGRFKNIVDSLATTAAVAGFLKASGKAYRKTSRKIEKKAQQLKEEKAGA